MGITFIHWITEKINFAVVENGASAIFIKRLANISVNINNPILVINRQTTLNCTQREQLVILLFRHALIGSEINCPLVYNGPAAHCQHAEAFILNVDGTGIHRFCITVAGIR